MPRHGQTPNPRAAFSAPAWVCIIALSVSTGCNAKPASEANAAATTAMSVPVRTARVRSALVPIWIAGYGTMSGGANAQAALGFAQTGRLAAVAVDVGDRVKRGTVLAVLERAPFAADVAQARAALAAATAVAAKTAAGSRAEVVAQTDAQITSARVALDSATSALVRREQLFRAGISAQVEVDAARAARASAQAQLRTLQAQRVTQIVPWQPDVAVAEAGVQEARAALLAARQRLDATTLTAPFAGTVTARLHDPGEIVDSSTPVVRIAQATVFAAQFAPADAERVALGDRATVEAGATRRTGRVIGINPAQADARTVTVLIRLGATGLAFGPGAYGRATIRVATRRELVVPSTAIVSDPASGTVEVFRQDGERYTPVSLTATTPNGDMTAVRSPNLHAGDIIVTAGAYALLAPPQAQHGDN